ncbi:DMT family transporter [Pseudogemmobacter humi]|uniref:EamA-like transporter family protein n=1 Tax=Pseudogemmobacter humi TaxID=2483812 RepID=A0A3P5XP27_9RHOB|nr:DMT family transporter [Pseudogemmobacter humi]VDC32113.1 EamA-like transporter family protein [Pseudogemmobacter humi]
MCDVSSTAIPQTVRSGRGPGPGAVSANLICMASMVAWAAGLPAAEYLIPILPSEQIGAIRIALAAAVLLPVWLALDGAAALRNARWPAGLAVGSLIGVAAWFLIIGQSHGGPVTAAVITASMPVVAIALEVLFDGRRLSAALLLGLVLSIVGGVLALDFGAAGAQVGLGALFCFASVLIYTLGSRLTVTAFPELSLTGRTALTLTGAALTMMLIAGGRMVLGGPLPDPALWGWPQVTALAVYAIGGLAICQLLWIVSIDRLGIGLSSLHTNASPFYVMLIMYLGFGAGWNWLQAGAAVLVGIGVLIAQGVVPLRRPR